MNIGFPTRCMTGGQENSGDEQIPTVKPDSDCFFFCQILLFIGYPILLGILKMGGEVLDMLVMGAIFIGHGADGDLILDDSHEC